MMDYNPLNALPKNWVRTEIGSIYDVVGGGTPSTTTDEYWGGDIPWITSADIVGVRDIKLTRYVTQKGIRESATSKVPKRTLLVVTRVGLGKIAITDKPICFSQDLQGLVQHSDLILPEYCLFYLSLQLQRLKFEGRGTTISGITKKQLKDTEFPLPPYREQHRIVAKIEELFSELDKGIESLKVVRAKLNIYRQAVLKHAFEGKLTAQWREENKDKIETPEQLLARIKQEREARYEQQLKEWKVAEKRWKDSVECGKKPSKPKKAADLLLLGYDALAELPPLPEGYVYTYLANLGELGRGKSKHRPRNAPELFGGPYPFIQTGEVKAAGRIIREHSQTYSELGLEQSKLWPEGTLCITIAANIAETAFLGFDGCFPDSVVGFTAAKPLVLPEYTELFIKSVRTRIEAYAPATAQKNINLTTLESLAVPLCSLEEQRILVDRLEAVLFVIDDQRVEIDNHLLKTDALRQSVLTKAFSGQLVPQDPNDEPASILLERIKAEKAARSQNNTRAKRRRTAATA